MVFSKSPLALILWGLCSFSAMHTPALATDVGVQSTMDRQIVKGADYPWRAIGRVQWAGVARRAHCTGALIGKSLVLTAAHCVYDTHTQNFIVANAVHFVAGYDRGNFAAHSVAKKIILSKKYDSSRYEAISNSPHDWALIVLEKPIGSDVGYLGWQAFGIKSHSKAQMDKAQLMLIGYPHDRREVLSVENGCKIEGFNFSGKLFIHDCSSVHGDSGGPFAIMREGRLSVIGLTNAAFGEVGDTKSTAVPLGPLAKRIKKLLYEDGTLSTNNPEPKIFGWAPSDRKTASGN